MSESGTRDRVADAPDNRARSVLRLRRHTKCSRSRANGDSVMTENEMNLDEPATRRDLRALRMHLMPERENHPTRRDLRDALANHPTHAQLDATVREVMLHIDRTVAQH